MISNILGEFLLSFAKISATQTSYKIPTYIYCFGIIIYFVQAFSNLMHLKQDSNQFIEIVEKITESTTIIHLVEFFNNSYLFWIVYVCLHIQAYFLIILVLILTFLKPKQNSELIQYFSSSYSTYISWFPILLEDILVEFNASLIIELGGYINIIFGIIGLLFTLPFSILCSYMSQSFQFADINLFRRKWSLMIIGHTLKFILVLISSYEYQEIATIVIFFCFSVVSIIDSLVVLPFVNMQVAKTYVGSAFFWLGCGLSIILYKEGVLKSNSAEDSIIVVIFGLCPLLSYLGIILFERIEYSFLQNTRDRDFWIFSQLLMNMNDDASKFRLYIALRHHVNNCKISYCFCQKYGAQKQGQLNNVFKSVYVYSDINDRVVRELNVTFVEIMKLIDSMFQRILIENKTQEVEVLYVSFLERFSGNQLLSYFNLNRINYSSYSLFFQLIYQVLSEVRVLVNQKLEEKILYANNQKSKSNEYDTTGLRVQEIVEIENLCPKFKSAFIQALQIKIQVWNILQQGNDNIEGVYTALLRQLQKFYQAKQKSENMITSLIENNLNSGFLKLMQLHHLIITNQISKAMKLEGKINELKNKDQYRDDYDLNNYNFLKGQSVLIRAGLSKQLGKILNKDNVRIGEFFNYNEEDMKSVQLINDLMPKHIADLHNLILFQYLQKGSSPLLYTTRKVFLMNKQQFLFPVSITVRNDFSNFDDCIFNVNLIKIPFKDLIMFDKHGALIGMSQKLFDQISQRESLFSYEELLRQGFIQILMPKLIKIIEGIRLDTLGEEDQNNQQFENISTTLVVNEQILQQCYMYNKSFDSHTSRSRSNYFEIVNQSHRESIKNLLNASKTSLNSQNHYYKVRFNLHSLFRRFKHLDIGVLNIMGYKIEKSQNLHYFVIEIIEIEKVNKNKKGMQSISDLPSDQKRSTQVQFEEYENDISEKKEELICQGNEKIGIFPQFQIDSPRMLMETPKETERGLLKSQQNTFVDNVLNFFQSFHNKLPYESNPRFISKNNLQEEGLPESLEVNDLVQSNQLNSIPQLVFKKFKTGKSKPKKNLEEQQQPQSSTSVVSKSERESLDEIYQQVEMTTSYTGFVRYKMLILFMMISCVITELILANQKIIDIALLTENLIIPFYFNSIYIDYCQSQLYINEQMEEEDYARFKQVISDRIEQQNKLISEDVSTYIGYQTNKIPTRSYMTYEKYQTVEMDLYQYQISAQNLYVQQSNLSLYSLLSRFNDNKLFSDYINDIQMEIIMEKINLVTYELQTLTIIFMAILIIPLFPITMNIMKMLIYMEKIILLVTRVSVEEALKETQKINQLKDFVLKSQGIKLLLQDYTSFIFQANLNKEKHKTKAQLLQTKIYNQKLPFTFPLLSSTLEVAILIFFLSISLIFLTELPNNFMKKASSYVEQSHKYQAIQQRNLFLEMLNRNLTIINQQDFIDENQDIINIFDGLEIPQEDIYYNDLCLNMTCDSDIANYYAKGLVGVFSQIALLYSKDNLYVDRTTLGYEALIKNFPVFVQPFIRQIEEDQNSELYRQILDLNTGFFYYMLLGCIGMLIFVGVWIFVSIKQYQNRIILIRHLLIWIPYEKLNEEITISLLKSIKSY